MLHTGYIYSYSDVEQFMCVIMTICLQLTKAYIYIYIYIYHDKAS